MSAYSASRAGCDITSGHNVKGMLLSGVLKLKKLDFPCCAAHTACTLETSVDQANLLPVYNLNGDKKKFFFKLCSSSRLLQMSLDQMA